MISDYFLHVFHLWGLNAMVTTLVMIICLLGVPKLSYFLRKALNPTREILKSLIKKRVIINVPMYVFLLVIVFKFYPEESKLLEKNIISSANITRTRTNVYWNEIWNGVVLYKFSSGISLILFLFGVHVIWTNSWIQRWRQRVFSNIFKAIKIVYSYVSIPIATPLSLLILLFVDTISQLDLVAFTQSYLLLTNQSLILLIIMLIVVYNIYKWFNFDLNIKVDFSGEIYLDDVSQLNKTRIHSIFYPRTINDIEYLISKAKSQGKTISLRGQAHTMGGQTLPSRTGNSSNYVCDLKYMNRIEYDGGTKEVLVEAGATWTHVIKKLNYYGRSPVIMQSYCTFSVGGTISVNAHGITSDDAMYNSVLNIEYIDMHGNRGECNREVNSELFSLMIGGYGLFGIITRLKLKTVPNVKTGLEYIRLQVSFMKKINENIFFFFNSLINFQIIMKIFLMMQPLK